jgi:hypothetical protein
MLQTLALEPQRLHFLLHPRMGMMETLVVQLRLLLLGNLDLDHRGLRT